MSLNYISRRKFLYGAGGFVLAGACTSVYATDVEPYALDITSKEISLGLAGKGSAPILAAHLSDFHDSPVVSISFIRKACEIAVAQKPQVIFLTGDYVTRFVSDSEKYSEALRVLSSHAPTYACFGNHDGGRWATLLRQPGYADTKKVGSMLEKAGIRILCNTSEKIKISGATLRLTGLGDLSSHACLPHIAYQDIPKDDDADAHILLSHNPDSKRLLNNYPWDLMLCGHTHGGQVKLPFIGAPILPISDRAFAEGLLPWEGRQIHVTRGVGNLFGFRFNCPPEISMLRLV